MDIKDIKDIKDRIAEIGIPGTEDSGDCEDRQLLEDALINDVNKAITDSTTLTAKMKDEFKAELNKTKTITFDRRNTR